MPFLWYLTGFCWNVISMFISLIPMSNAMGWICIDKKKFFWQIDEEELLDELDKGER